MDKSIKFKVIKELNGIKYMSKSQVDDFIDYMLFSLGLEDNSINRNIIIDGIKEYFNLKL